VPVHETERIKNMRKKDSELFKPLLDTAESYLRAYCDGKQSDDEKAKIALRVLSLYRQILKVEKEREQIKSEWQKVITGVAELKKVTAIKAKKKRKARTKAKHRG
jgi:tellurite resistance protein